MSHQALAADRRPAEQLVSLLTPGSFAADQYRKLRLTVERLHANAGLQVLAVTSPGPGEGKSVTTLNLAGALAQAGGARVLVIDADLRRPRVAEYLGLAALDEPGLAGAMQESGLELSALVRRLDRFNLSVLPAGAPQEAPYELLNSPRLDSLLTEARRRYDYVLIDTPPLLPFPDCRVIGRCVDGYLLTIAAHRTPRKLAAEALDLLDAAKVIGVVFNGDDRPRAAHYGYYRYGYGR
jgi:capsular exopolysaccharide synthesis family protein